jgi:hypothetical protein
MAISKLAIQPAQIFLSLALSLGAVQSAHSFEVSSGDQQACVNDAFRLCSAEIPDSERVAVCLDSNVENLSPACHAVIQQAMLTIIVANELTSSQRGRGLLSRVALR